jgi:hypothetical protein
LSTETNFNGKLIQRESDLWEFAAAAKFPSHGLILRKSNQCSEEIFKGITDPIQLQQIFIDLSIRHQTVYVETDMRAMYNPTRQKVIEAAGKKLLAQIRSECPSCKMPGFSITSVTKGLKCTLCAAPTQSVLSYIYECKHCQYQKEEMYPHHKTTEDPGRCDFCNP